MLLSVNTFCDGPSLKKMVSLANYRQEILRFWFPTFVPLKISFYLIILIKAAKPSTTIRNKNNARGLPCLRPLYILNSFVGLSFTNTNINVDSRHPLIHRIHLTGNPKIFIIEYKKFHLIASYAFSKSVLKIQHCAFLFFALSTISFAIRTLSKIFCPPRNTDWPS